MFLVREILGITGISIAENGMEVQGVRFEITILRACYHLKNESASKREQVELSTYLEIKYPPIPNLSTTKNQTCTILITL